jgi:hypothetical protein
MLGLMKRRDTHDALGNAAGVDMVPVMTETHRCLRNSNHTAVFRLDRMVRDRGTRFGMSGAWKWN